jgi:hypothetical protein
MRLAKAMRKTDRFCTRRPISPDPDAILENPDPQKNKSGVLWLALSGLPGVREAGQWYRGDLYYVAAENQRFPLSRPDLPWHKVIRALYSPVLCYMVLGGKGTAGPQPAG